MVADACLPALGAAILGDKLGSFHCLFVDMDGSIACMKRQKIIQQMHVESANGW
jgi:hypothetical protein